MDNLFFKEFRGNLWAISKGVGFVKGTQPNEEGKETEHYLTILEGGMSTEISKPLYVEMLKSLITLEAVDEPEVKDE